MIREELIRIAEDASKEGRRKESATIRMEAYGVGTGEPEEKHSLHHCGWPSRVLVSQHTASVTCAMCGAELVPMDVLRAYARHERHFAFMTMELVREQKELRLEVEELKRIRANQKAAIRRGNK